MPHKRLAASSKHPELKPLGLFVPSEERYDRNRLPKLSSSVVSVWAKTAEVSRWRRPTMTDYQIQPHSRRCVTTGRDLQPGERYYTALVEEGDRFVRHDYCSQAWQGPPAGAFSFWSGRVPEPNETAKPRFDDDVLEEC